MVDFNLEGTMSKPPKEVMALIIIEKLYNFLEAEEERTKMLLNGASMSLAVSRARLRSLFLVTHEMLKRRIKNKEDFDKVSGICMNLKDKIDDTQLIKSYLTILQVLDDMRLLRLDTKKQFDRGRVEEANKHHGY